MFNFNYIFMIIIIFYQINIFKSNIQMTFLGIHLKRDGLIPTVVM